MQRSSLVWLRSAAWDTCLVAYCWVPFYLWVVFGLGFGAEAYGSEALSRRDTYAAIALATTVALGCTYVHRHYTLLLVYGDRSVFAARARAFIVAPLLLLLGVGLARYSDTHSSGRAPFLSPWHAVLLTAGLWNVWHTVRQRYGILRTYARKAGGGLECPEQGKWDQALLWSAIVFIAVVTLLFRADTFATHGNALRVYRSLRPALDAPGGAVLAVLVLGLALIPIVIWGRREFSATVPTRERIPRLSFLVSTLALLGVFIVHGPVLGYLCFGVAHALEYLAFVHHYGSGKYKRDSAHPGLAAALLGRPVLGAPMLIGGLLALYLVLREFRSADLYVTYYVGTSLLHFLYDGWIWKVRRPEVAVPLGVRA